MYQLSRNLMSTLRIQEYSLYSVADGQTISHITEMQSKTVLLPWIKATISIHFLIVAFRHGLLHPF